MTASTAAPSRLVRSSSSRATKRARSTARASLSDVPALQNGVRQPATIATRRPFRTGITFSSRDVTRTKPTMALGGAGVVARHAVLVPHAGRGAPIDGRRARGRARHRRGDHGRRDRARRGAARLPHGPRGPRGLRGRHVLAFLTARPRRPPLSRAARSPPRVRGEPRAARAAADRAPPGAPIAVPVSGVPRRPRSRLEGRRRHVAVRSARGVPQRAAPPLARTQGRAAARAGTAGAGVARRGALLRRADRRRPSRDRDGAERRAGGRARRELRRGHEPVQAGRAGRGATVRDALTGRSYTVRALVVVNATGPWADELRRLDDPAAEPLLRLTKGAHVAVPQRRLGHTHAVTLTSPIDGRVMFVLPWAETDLSYIGTTDTDEDASPDDV